MAGPEIVNAQEWLKSRGSSTRSNISPHVCRVLADLVNGDALLNKEQCERIEALFHNVYTHDIGPTPNTLQKVQTLLQVATYINTCRG